MVDIALIVDVGQFKGYFCQYNSMLSAAFLLGFFHKIEDVLVVVTDHCIKIVVVLQIGYSDLSIAALVECLTRSPLIE